MAPDLRMDGSRGPDSGGIEVPGKGLGGADGGRSRRRGTGGYIAPISVGEKRQREERRRTGQSPSAEERGNDESFVG